MRVLFDDDDKTFKFEHVMSLEVKNGKTKIKYIDSRGEVHEEIGDLPEGIYAFRE